MHRNGDQGQHHSEQYSDEYQHSERHRGYVDSMRLSGDERRSRTPPSLQRSLSFSGLVLRMDFGDFAAAQDMRGAWAECIR